MFLLHTNDTNASILNAAAILITIAINYYRVYKWIYRDGYTLCYYRVVGWHDMDSFNGVRGIHETWRLFEMIWCIMTIEDAR